MGRAKGATGKAVGGEVGKEMKKQILRVTQATCGECSFNSDWKGKSLRNSEQKRNMISLKFYKKQINTVFLMNE